MKGTREAKYKEPPTYTMMGRDMKKEVRAAITGAAVGLLLGTAWMWGDVLRIDAEIAEGYERLNQDNAELAIRAEYWNQHGRPDLAELCK